MSSLTQLAWIANLSTTAALTKLAEIYRESRQNATQTAPYVSLHLKSGLSMRGEVIAISEEAPRTVVFLLFDPNSREPTDVTYVLFDEIAALTIHGAMSVIEHLSDGSISRPLGPAPSLAEISRALQAMTNEINALTESQMTAELQNIPETGPSDLYHALLLTARDLWAALKALAANELGRQGLKEKGFKFFLAIGEEAKIQVNRSHFHIYVAMRDQQVERVSRESLRVNLDEFL